MSFTIVARTYSLIYSRVVGGVVVHLINLFGTSYVRYGNNEFSPSEVHAFVDLERIAVRTKLLITQRLGHQSCAENLYVPNSIYTSRAQRLGSNFSRRANTCVRSRPLLADARGWEERIFTLNNLSDSDATGGCVAQKRKHTRREY